MFVDISSGNILSLIKSNCDLNAEWIKGNVSVQELNFYNDNYSEELTAHIINSRVIIAADGLLILFYFLLSDFKISISVTVYCISCLPR